jgi:two-component system, OmpR family, alkaline phosphatase synthesis response regulator PhoP
MARAHIFVVDDEPDILELVHYNLTQHGYDVSCSLSGEEGLVQMRSRPPDLLLLDVMLPGMDGLEVCKALKQHSRTADMPIIMLTARSEEADIVAGLELGADDYLTKPFSTRVLLARIKAVLRRHYTATPTETEELIRGDLVIRPGRYEVLAMGQLVQLTRTEFRILHLLARRPGWVFTRNQIIEAAQGDDTSVTARSVDVHMVSLRRKLGSYGEVVETIRGVGYRFKDSEE